jgi:DNA-binding transcriptional regulator GbsR (MarR family)
VSPSYHLLLSVQLSHLKTFKSFSEEEYGRKVAVQEDVIEKLRSRLNETEKKNREVEKRYKEQVSHHHHLFHIFKQQN